MATPSVEDIIFQLTAGWNSNPGERQTLFTYADTDTCNRVMRIPYELAGAATDTSVNIGTYFDTIDWVLVVDHSNIGMKVGKASGAGKFTVAAGRFMVIAESATFTVYLDNLSASDKSFGEIIVFGSSS